MLNILMIGDIVGNVGRNAVRDVLPSLYKEYNLDLVLANGENAAGGKGITYEILQELYNYNINIITMGNHVWDKKEILDFIEYERTLIRPANFPEGTPGNSYVIYEIENNIKVGVINLLGSIYLQPLISPFLIIDNIINEIKKETQIIIVDFHAEATSEKVAMGWYLDGKVSGVLGTHTHIQTADERILPDGSAYITDVGMTGPRNSVLGVKRDLAIQKFLTQMPVRFEMANGKGQLNGVVLTIDPLTGKAKSIERIQKNL
ncbi:hypothetical protein SAMN00017405_1489 [Desulfonispora thiosulfatigenes DSM 11270]|uniref:TIGR00282 family metallophosphoesterase n=1 Tax=Desulfonispora thiosulfatigenes DSM 11270 TaxID=656914 RepID=A0A1W1VS95_DESTI|nr:TIGR00282 family metallophosphoesterase [Desulfonispora thiosulfatigenes]SMB96265.1 hypothetical protein SAMN00017405_1489 [Desulfonispora thiosulfatigenes DSM 11270]